VELDELEAYRKHHLHVRRVSWTAVLGCAIVCGLAVAFAWSPVHGAAVTAMLTLIGLPMHMRYDKARWLKRFPELRDPRIKWHRAGT
jgi:hypothetical protein